MKMIFLTLSLIMGIFTSAQQLLINPQTTLRSTAGATLVLESVSGTNKGLLTLKESTLYLKGSTTTSLQGDSTWKVGHLVLDKNLSSLLLNSPLMVDEKVTFQGGMLDLNGQVLTLASDAFLENESEQSRVVGMNGGYIQLTKNLNAPLQVNPGNLGLVISSSEDLGTVAIRRKHSVVQGLSASVLRSFEVVPAHNTALNATSRLYYFDGELNNSNETLLAMWKQTTTSWSNLGPGFKNPALNFIENTNLSSLSSLAIAEGAVALPVKFSSFTAECKPTGVLLSWTTAMEENIQDFSVEKSTNGVTWKVVKTVAPYRGTYAYLDVNREEKSFYRVLATDRSGEKTFTSVRQTDCQSKSALTVYPNPCTSYAHVSYTAKANGKITIRITDATERTLYQKDHLVIKGPNLFDLNLSGYASGVYQVQVLDKDKSKSIQLNKQ